MDKVKLEDLDYLDFIKDFNSVNISFEQRVQNPQFYYQFALDRLNEKNCLSLLDVGCADGVFSKLCLKQGLKVSGVEISAQGREDYKRNIGKEALANLEQISLQKFDVVVLLEILEHLSSPEEMLKKVWPIADKMVIFTVPIKDSIKSPFHKVIFQFYDVYNLASKFTNDFKIYMINKSQRLGKILNLFGVVLYK